MNAEYTAVVKQQGDWWIGWIEEVPGVNCQERSREELLESLRVTLREAIEFNRQDAIASAGSEYKEEKIAVTGWRGLNYLNISDQKVVSSLEKVTDTRGGEIPVKTKDRQYRGIPKSMTILQEKYAKTLE